MEEEAHLPELHVVDDATVDLAERPPMRAVRLLHGIPPFLPMSVNPAPIRVCRAAERDV
jgi:hypothetical protein